MKKFPPSKGTLSSVAVRDMPGESGEAPPQSKKHVFKPPKHLQAHMLTKKETLENPSALVIDFNEILKQHNGNYKEARRAVAQAARAKRAQFVAEHEERHTKAQDEMMLKEHVALSFTVGRPTLVNPAQKAQWLSHRPNAPPPPRAPPAAGPPGAALRGASRAGSRASSRRSSRATELSGASGLTSIAREGFEKEMTDRLRRALVRGELAITHQGMKTLPQALGDTISLQISPLHKLNLAGNKLRNLLDHRIKGVSCYHMRNIRELDLGQNQLTDLPNDFGVLMKLQHLNLERNKLSMLPGTFYHLKNLEWLRLNHNNFSDLPEEFSRMKGLTHLDLSNNMLPGLPPGFAALKNLKYLDLSANGMLQLGILRPIRDEDTGRFVALRDPLSGKKYYFDFRTGESRTELNRGRPDDESTRAENSTLAGVRTLRAKASDASHENSRRTARDPEYMAERKRLAEAGRYEWGVDQDPAAQTVYYVNNVTGETQWEMPATLDIFGNLWALETLKLNQNLLRALPDSLSKLTNLRHFEATNNNIEALPRGLGEMHKLRKLKLNVNEIAQLPSSMAGCTALEELHLTGNQFAVFPDFVGGLGRLRLLMLGGNALVRVPPSVGHLTQLRELQLYGNPLQEPPPAVLVEGLAKVLWVLRQADLALRQGPTPAVGMHASGLRGERLELAPEFARKLQDRMRLARDSHELSLHLQGLEEVPPACFRVEGLLKLTLDYNRLDPERLVFPEKDLTALTDLSLKACGLAEFPASICMLKTLEALRLEDNKLGTLPREVERLWRLKSLNLAINHMHTLPESICKLSTLTALDLDNNALEILPPSIGDLKALKALTLQRNLLLELPASVTTMRGLESLNADGNLLPVLPEGMGALQLRVLKVSHNRLEYLPDDFLLPSLVGTLGSLWVSNNNLLDLPASLVEMRNLRDLHVDQNPMRSPPPDLIAEGTQAVVQYCHLRFGRLHELARVFDEEGLAYDEDHLTPDAREVLAGDTGYLLADDLAAFDATVDRFLNGKFYLYPLPAEKIVADLQELKAQRQYAFFRLIFDELLEVLEDIAGDHEDFSANILNRRVLRPWGRRGEDVPCWALSLQYLLRETTPNELFPDYRPAVYDVVRRNLPDSIFPYSKETLKRAIDTFEDPYGKVAAVEKFKFPACECIDPETNKWSNHMRCRPKTLIIKKVIYSDEEADRRDQEDGVYIEAFKKVEKKVRSHLAKRRGVKESKLEGKERKARLKVDIENTRAQIDLFRSQLGEAKLAFEEVTKRKADFDAGKPFPFHRLADPDEALELVMAGQRRLEAAEQQLKGAEDRLAALRKRRKMSPEEAVLEAHADLVQKYCHETYLTLLERHRREAFRARARRPWDGPDGEEFELWKEFYDPENDSFAPDYWWELSATDPMKKKMLDTKKFNWEGCDNMRQFASYIYTFYLEVIKPEQGGNAELLSLEDEEKSDGGGVGGPGEGGGGGGEAGGQEVDAG